MLLPYESSNSDPGSSAEILFSVDNNAHAMHNQNVPLFLPTFGGHLKRQIQDPRNIEHFFQVWFRALSIEVACDSKYLLFFVRPWQPWC